MTMQTAAPWLLRCPWCDWEIWVGARGMHGGDVGSGFAAAHLGELHANLIHGKTWAAFLAAESEHNEVYEK